MAFRSNTATRATRSNAQDDSWKADGFVNIYLTRKNGERAKLGVITLRDSKENEAQLREWLESDPANIGKLAQKLVIDYRSAKAGPDSGFDLD